MQEVRHALVNGPGIPHAGAPDERPRVAVTVSSLEANSGPKAMAEGAGRRKLGLRVVLTGLVVVTVAITALLIHLTWSYTAQRNVRDVAGQLNAQIIESVRHELHATLNDAWSVQEALRSIFYQGAIQPEDEGKREFVFLALLQSQPSLSWVSFGFPNGSFFGAQKASDTEINMVEVSWDAAHKSANLRVDHYHPEAGGNTHFDKRDGPSPYKFDALEQDWYKRAVADGEPGWNMVSTLPESRRQAISTSLPYYQEDHTFGGVINIVIELDRLSRFLSNLQVGTNGTAAVLDRNGHVIAAADPDAIREQQKGDMPSLASLGQKNPLLALAQRLLDEKRVDPAMLGGTRQLEARSAAGDAYFVTFAPLQFQRWVVVTVIPQRDFLASIERAARMLLLGLVAVTIILALIAVFFANRLIASPLLQIAAQLKHIETFQLDRITRLVSRLRELDDLSVALIQMRAGLASFQKFIPTDLVRTLVARGIEAAPGGHHETLTVMFTDLVGFTAISEQLGDSVVAPLTEYLESSSGAITRWRGTIDKFIGDAVMAFWGAPVPNADHAVDACAAALECQRLLARQREDAAGSGRLPLRMRIGINSGSVLVGNIGSRDRLSYTVIGDPVNLASRLEPLNKLYGTEIIIGDDTRRLAGDRIVARRLDRVAVYGKNQGVAIHELLAMAGDGLLERWAWVATYEAALDAYAERRWAEAIRLCESTIATRGQPDRPALQLIGRCRRYQEAPPPADWNGLTTLETK
jgi:adenylate cyclase